jgi:glycosyltransferase involved in cell wall biosynthesis
MPLVSVIVPCYNEQSTIRLLLDALWAQTFPRPDMEVIIADGMSTDFTRQEISSFQSEHPALMIVVVDNPHKTIPAGLNRAIQSAQGEFIVRLDAHSKPYPDYVARCVNNLQQGLGENIGGVWEIKPGKKGWIAESIAVAAAHPLGVGDARYRIHGRAGPVDTVPFGAYRKNLFELVGLYNTSLQTNEDYELNTRIRATGGTIWLDPEIRSVYYARSSLSALAHQYWRYGYWKAQMLRLYPRTIRWRQVLPPLFVLGIVVLGLLSIWLAPASWLLAAGAGLYGLALFAVGIQTAAKYKKLPYLLGVPLAIAVMHFSWGGAFLWSWVSKVGRT